MSWGGERPGAGRKPGPERIVKRRKVKHPIPLMGTSARVKEPDVEALLIAPDGLPPDVQAIWQIWAPAAIAERTLCTSTAAGFEHLCQQWVYVAAIVARINHLGAGTQEAGPYLLTYLKSVQRLDASLARFKLTAFGKPAIAEKPKQAVNRWAMLNAGGER